MFVVAGLQGTVPTPLPRFKRERFAGQATGRVCLVGLECLAIGDGCCKPLRRQNGHAFAVSLFSRRGEHVD